MMARVTTSPGGTGYLHVSGSGTYKNGTLRVVSSNASADVGATSNKSVAHVLLTAATPGHAAAWLVSPPDASDRNRTAAYALVLHNGSCAHGRNQTGRQWGHARCLRFAQGGAPSGRAARTLFELSDKSGGAVGGSLWAEDTMFGGAGGKGSRELIVTCADGAALIVAEAGNNSDGVVTVSSSPNFDAVLGLYDGAPGTQGAHFELANDGSVAVATFVIRDGWRTPDATAGGRLVPQSASANNLVSVTDTGGFGNFTMRGEKFTFGGATSVNETVVTAASKRRAFVQVRAGTHPKGRTGKYGYRSTLFLKARRLPAPALAPAPAPAPRVSILLPSFAVFARVSLPQAALWSAHTSAVTSLDGCALQQQQNVRTARV